MRPTMRRAATGVAAACAAGSVGLIAAAGAHAADPVTTTVEGSPGSLSAAGISTAEVYLPLSLVKNEVDKAFGKVVKIFGGENHGGNDGGDAGEAADTGHTAEHAADPGEGAAAPAGQPQPANPGQVAALRQAWNAFDAEAGKVTLDLRHKVGDGTIAEADVRQPLNAEVERLGVKYGVGDDVLVPGTRQGTRTYLVNEVDTGLAGKLTIITKVDPETPSTTSQPSPTAPTAQPSPTLQPSAGSPAPGPSGMSSVLPQASEPAPLAAGIQAQTQIAPGQAPQVPLGATFDAAPGLSPDFGEPTVNSQQQHPVIDLQNAGQAQAIAAPKAESQREIVPTLIAFAALAVVAGALVRTWVVRRSG